MGSRIIRRTRRYLITLAAAFGLLATAGSAECSLDVVSLRGNWGEAQFSTEVALTVAEQQRGLMFRKSLAGSASMLFVYPRPRRANFWMKNTLIPLDMIFADKTGLVQRVHSNAVPRDLTLIRGGAGIQYVLEINGGLAQRYGIGKGTQLRHPLIGQDAAIWPC